MIGTVVTMGFGSFGSVNLLPTLGYATEVVVITPTIPGVELALSNERTQYALGSERPHYSVPEE